MATNASLARIFGSDNDSILLAPIGTALPSSIADAVNGAFDDVGWLNEDGISEALSGSKSKIRGHQGNAVVRTRMTEPGTEISFVALESKALTNGLRYVEKSVSTANGVRSATRSPSQRVTARAAIIELYDADDLSIKERFVIPRFEIVPNGDRTFGNNDISGYPFLGEIIGDYYHYSNLPTPKTAWTLTINGTPTGGTYTLLVNGYATAPIAYNAANTAIAAAINAISGVTGVSGVTATGSGPYSITFPTSVILAANGAGLTGGTSPSAVTS